MSKEKSKNIGFDLDDVLLDFCDALLKHLNAKYNKDVKREAINHYFVEDFFGIPRSEGRELFDNFFFHEDHLHAVPVSGAQEVIESLSKDSNLHIITAKPEILRDITLTWLRTHYPERFSSVHFANFFTDTHEKRKKSEICLEHNIDIFVDDSYETAIDVSSVGIPVLLFDAPWNQQDYLPKGVTRIYSWRDIEKEIHNLLQ